MGYSYGLWSTIEKRKKQEKPLGGEKLMKDLIFKGQKAFFCLMATLIVFLGCAQKEKKENLADHYSRLGVSYIHKKNYSKSLFLLLKAVRADSKNPVHYNNVGYNYFLQKKYPQAKHYFKKAISLDKRYYDAYQNLSRVYLTEKKYKDVVRILYPIKNVKEYEFHDHIKMTLGEAYYRLSKYSDASSYLNSVVKTGRADCRAYVLLGRSLYYNKRYSHSEKTFQKSLNVCPKEKRKYLQASLKQASLKQANLKQASLKRLKLKRAKAKKAKL